MHNHSLLMAGNEVTGGDRQGGGKEPMGAVIGMGV